VGEKETSGQRNLILPKNPHFLRRNVASQPIQPAAIGGVKGEGKKTRKARPNIGGDGKT